MTSKRNTTYKIGITGNICAGKSLVLNTLQRFGVSTLDAEATAMNLLTDNPQRLGIRLSEHFGAEVIDNRGRLSRKKLNAILYTDMDKKAFFDEKLNPFLRDEVKRFLYSPMGSYLRAVESPLLLETDTQHLYDEVWMVITNPDIQLKRLMERDQLSPAEARHLIDSQWSQEKKAALCTRIIGNSADVHATETQVRKALDELKNKVFKASS